MICADVEHAGCDWNVACQRFKIILAFCALVVVGGLQNATVANAQSLHERIDQLLDPTHDPLTAEPADDAIFLRRLSLDLRNTVPTTEEVRAYTTDNALNKKAAWIDKFLADPLFEERMVTWLDLTLMERRPAKRIDRQKWIDWLRSIVSSSTAIDQWTREMITAPWWELDKQPMQRFFLDRDGDPNLITRDFARIFLGRDLQCAQCHDHPIIDDYLQQDYQGLLSFFAASAVQEVAYKDAEGKDQKANLYVERPASNGAFESVFDKGKQRLIGAKVPHQISVWDNYQTPRERLQHAPASVQFGDVTRLPQISRREQLAEIITNPAYRPFAENWSNRLWALMLGRGVVDPVDMQQADNPATNDQLLTLIAEGLAELKFDTKSFLREIALTQAYQRGHWLPFESKPDVLESFNVADIQQRLGELTLQVESLTQQDESAEKAREEGTAALQKKEAELIAVVNELSATDAKLTEQIKKSNEAKIASDAARKLLDGERVKLELLSDATAKLEQVKALNGKEDAELTTAIATAIQRRDASNAEVPKLEAALATNQTNLDASLKSEQELAAMAMAISQKVESFHETMEQLRQNELALRQSWRAIRQALRTAQSAKYYLHDLNDFLATKAEIANLQNRVTEAAAQIVAQNQIAKQTREAVATASQMKDQTAQDRDRARAAQKTLEERLAQLDREIKQLDSSRSQLAESSKLVSTASALEAAMNELLQAADLRKSNVAQVQLEMQEATKNTAGVEQAFDHAMVEVEKQTEASEIAQATLAKLTQEADAAKQLIEDAEVKLKEKGSHVLEHEWRIASAANLKPLTPEQFCWSILRVMGIFDQYVANERAELDKQQPLPADPPPNEQQLAERNRLVVRRAVDKLRGNADTFANLFAPGAGQADAFFASAEQALYMSNGGVIYGWSAASNSNVTQRIVQANDATVAAEDLYQTLLCRKPTEAEVAVVTKYLDAPSDQRAIRAQELVWAMLCGVEFRFVQ